MGAAKGNKNAEGCETSGRPPFYSTAEQLQAKIDEYFDCGAHKRTVLTLAGPVEIPTITICGLALFLGFASRQSLLDYGEKIEFIDTIKKARLRIEMNYEEMLTDGKPTGAIFALKNLGWEDKTKTEHSGQVTVTPSIKFVDD